MIIKLIDHNNDCNSWSAEDAAKDALNKVASNKDITKFISIWVEDGKFNFSIAGVERYEFIGLLAHAMHLDLDDRL